VAEKWNCFVVGERHILENMSIHQSY